MTKKHIGIWMDHSIANIIDRKNLKEERTIRSEFTQDTKEEVLGRSEKTMHNKENQMQEAFYKKISGVILNYDHVLLFGPTNAKDELHNYLNKDLHFKTIQVDLLSEDNMTENEKTTFVQRHFSKYD
jgi:stalled ribosome rescue protein Dom34